MPANAARFGAPRAVAVRPLLGAIRGLVNETRLTGCATRSSSSLKSPARPFGKRLANAFALRRCPKGVNKRPRHPIIIDMRTAGSDRLRFGCLLSDRLAYDRFWADSTTPADDGGWLLSVDSVERLQNWIHPEFVRACNAIDNLLATSSERLPEGTWSRTKEDCVVPHVREGATPLQV